MNIKCQIRISIIIPVYLAENTISILCEKLHGELLGISPYYEIILVNDAPPDNSWRKIESLCQCNKQIKGINLSRNFGQHAAISAGLKYAFGEKIVIMDCDLQDSPEDLPKLWNKLQEGYDIVMARRIQRKENIWRRFISRTFHLFLSLKTGKKTDPAIANYSIYSRKVIEEYYANHKNKAFSVLNLKRDYTFATVDVIQGLSERGKSGYTLSKLFSVAFLLLFPKKNKDALYIIEKTLNISVENYGVRLLPLTGEKIELVRQWRNDPKISQYMAYREYITSDMQQKWFESVNNPNNYYFIIEFEGKEVGLINIKELVYSKKEGEIGFFIYDDSYLNSDISFRTSLCMGDFTTYILDLRIAYIHVLKTNKRAIQYNKMIGYELSENQDEIENQKYYITRDTYIKQREYILNLLN